jgi:hypothetical protein
MRFIVSFETDTTGSFQNRLAFESSRILRAVADYLYDQGMSDFRRDEGVRITDYGGKPIGTARLIR